MIRSRGIRDGRWRAREPWRYSVEGRIHRDLVQVLCGGYIGRGENEDTGQLSENMSRAVLQSSLAREPTPVDANKRRIRRGIAHSLDPSDPVGGRIIVDVDHELNVFLRPPGGYSTLIYFSHTPSRSLDAISSVGVLLRRVQQYRHSTLR